MPKVQLGLCCINNGLRAQNIYCSRSHQLSTINTHGAQKLVECSIQNCKDLLTLLEWNEAHDIRVMRISSELFPHYANPRVEKYSMDHAQPILDQIGEYARKHNHRLTFHPGQYNVIGTPSETIFEHTSLELDMHAEILDRMGCDQNSVMVVHGGGVYGDKSKTMNRWVENFYKLPERVRRRLVLENCEKSYNIEDCLQLARRVNIPVVFDTHHHACYVTKHPDIKLHSPEHYMPEILESWRARNIKPKFHVSESAPGRDICKHSDYIESIPNYLLTLKEDIDIMVEAKAKEQAIFNLYVKYPFLYQTGMYIKKKNNMYYYNIIKK